MIVLLGLAFVSGQLVLKSELMVTLAQSILESDNSIIIIIKK